MSYFHPRAQLQKFFALMNSEWIKSRFTSLYLNQNLLREKATKYFFSNFSFVAWFFCIHGKKGSYWHGKWKKSSAHEKRFQNKFSQTFVGLLGGKNCNFMVWSIAQEKKHTQARQGIPRRKSLLIMNETVVEFPSDLLDSINQPSGLWFELKFYCIKACIRKF